MTHKGILRVLEGGGHLHLAPDAQEQRTRVAGQAVDQVDPECCEIELTVGDERGHTRPAVGARDGHAVDVGRRDAAKRADRL